MLCKIECSKVILFNNTRNSIVAESDYATIENIELGNCENSYKFKGNVIIKLNTNKVIIKNYKYETDDVFTLRLNGCVINEFIYCDIEIYGVWLQSNLKNKSNTFETTANAYADVKRIEE